MRCYEVTYSVNELHVKGYIGLPTNARLTTDDIAETVRRVTGAQSRLPVEPVTYEPDEDFPRTTPIPKTQELSGTGLPALLYCRGGIGRVGLSRLEWIFTFCQLGFVVFAPWYRGTLGTDGRDEFGGQDNADAIVAVQILQELSCVDSSHITVLGFSRGSVNATQVVIAHPNVNSLILWGGVSDLAATYEERVDLRRMLRRVVGGTPRKVPDEYRKRSPIYHVRDIPCRTLVVHSTQDPQVAFHHGVDMYHALVGAGVDTSWHGYHGYAHHFHPDVRQAVMERMLEWALLH